jgi:hypothetical protein
MVLVTVGTAFGVYAMILEDRVNKRNIEMLEREGQKSDDDVGTSTSPSPSPSPTPTPSPSPSIEPSPPSDDVVPAPVENDFAFEISGSDIDSDVFMVD